MATAEQTRRYNTLNNTRMIQLYSWLSSKRSQFDEQKASIAEVAKLATKELGFSVSVHNIENIRRCGNVSWTVRRGPRPGNKAGVYSSNKLRISKLQARMDALEAWVQAFDPDSWAKFQQTQPDD